MGLEETPTGDRYDGYPAVRLPTELLNIDVETITIKQELSAWCDENLQHYVVCKICNMRRYWFVIWFRRYEDYIYFKMRWL
jgi:hypothetical protein